MRSARRALRLAGLLAGAILLASAVTPVVAQESLIDFSIQDQFGETYTDEAYQRGVFVVVGADRKGSAYSPDWTRSIRAVLIDLPEGLPAQAVGLAHMRSVPRLLRGFVRRQFPKQPDAWVLLDWKGLFEDAYGYEKDSSTVLVFLDGQLVHRTHGQEVEPDKVDAIRRRLERSLEASG